LAPVSFSNRALAWLTTSGQPFCASLISQTVTVLPLPSVLIPPPDEEDPELHALVARPSAAATTTALLTVRFTLASIVGCRLGRTQPL